MATHMSYRTESAGTTATNEHAAIVRASRSLSTGAVAAILIMMAGWGWNNGQFVQPVMSSWGPIADGLHLVPVVALLVLGVSYVRGIVASKDVRGAVVGLTIVAVTSIIGVAVMTILGITNPDPNSVGVHTLEDAMPAIVLTLGSLLWLAVLLTRRAK